ncbi:MAG: ferredoxin III, nif-specific [Acidobacteriaceae bacterium]
METTQAAVQAVSRDGRTWYPLFLVDIDSEVCIGCGRCFKVCGRSVMTLQGITEDGAVVSLDEDEEIERKIMTVTDPGACIGCAACSRVCPKNCQTHAAA